MMVLKVKESLFSMKIKISWKIKFGTETLHSDFVQLLRFEGNRLVSFKVWVKNTFFNEDMQVREAVSWLGISVLLC